MDSKKAVVIENNFLSLNNELLNIGATYSSLLVFNDDNNVIFSNSSDKDWSEEFTSSGMHKNCYLLKEAHEQMRKKDSSFTVVWDFYSPHTDKEKELEELRKYKNIVHGVGFYFKNIDGNKILLSVAGKYSDINFGLTVLKHRSEVYKALRQVMMR